MRSNADDHSFAVMSPVAACIQPTQLPVEVPEQKRQQTTPPQPPILHGGSAFPPAHKQLYSYPLCYVINDNSPNAGHSEKLEHKLEDHFTPTPKFKGVSRRSKTHHIHGVSLHYFCNSQDRDLRPLCKDMQMTQMYESCAKFINKDPVLKQANNKRKASNIKNRSLAIRRLKEILTEKVDSSSLTCIES